MSFAKCLSTLILFLSLSIFAYADTPKSLADELAPRGITYDYKNNTLDILIDETKAKATIPLLQEQGILPKDITSSDIEQMPVTAAVEAVGMSFTVVLVHNIFKENPTLEKIHVDAYFMPSDAGIFTRRKPCFSFDFDRATYNKIDWNNVTTKDFMLQTTNFALQQWCSDKIVAESKH